MAIVNSGPTIKGESGKFMSIYSGLPLRGGERVFIKVKGNNETKVVHLTLLHPKSIFMFQV